MKTYNEVYNEVKSRLSEQRFYHSECVAARAVELATIYKADRDSARLVGIAHDIAKEMPNEEKIEYCKKNYLEVDDIELASPGLLHAKIGADIAKKEFGFSEDLCSTIKYHTTGKANMSLLDKILFVADMTGADRQFPDKEQVVKLANESLDECMKYCLKTSILHRIKDNKKVHLNTVIALNYFME